MHLLFTEKLHKMTPQQFKAIRIKMKLTQSQMAAWLKLSDGRIIRSWESGQSRIPGSVEKCFELAGFLNQHT